MNRPHVIITVAGGLIQGVLTDRPCDVTILDYDIEGYEDDRLIKVPDLDGDMEEAYVSSMDPDVSSEWHERVLSAIELARALQDKQ